MFLISNVLRNTHKLLQILLSELEPELLGTNVTNGIENLQDFVPQMDLKT